MVITGAGRGLGRAYARLLASRGAEVVVNDLGGAIDGSGTDMSVAADAVAQIVADGGIAIADTSDVSTAAGAGTLIDAALARFDRVDAVINNAGIVRWGAIPELDEAALHRVLGVHVDGAFHTTRAAWPHMVEQGHGRIVMTTSAGIFGLPNNTAYATAKAALIGMTRSLALTGAPHGITVNLIAPGAATRMGGDEDEATMAPDLVAPLVAYLVHDDCPVTGEMYAAGFGRFARMFIASTEGYVHPDRAATIEDVAEHWDEIHDERNYWVPKDLTDWSGQFMQHLRPDSGGAQSP